MIKMFAPVVLLALLSACPAEPTAPAETPTKTPASDVIASGTISLPDGVTATGAAVFVSIRDPKGGPPGAAKKFPAGPFPMEFTLTDADKVSMGPPRPIPAEFTLKAKLDADGNAMSTTEGDFQAVLLTKSGTTGVKLELAAVSQ